MAKVEKSKIERVVTEDGVVMHLSMEEARTLAAILTKVGGSAERSPRKHSAAIYLGLVDAIGGGDRWGWDRWAAPETGLLKGYGPGLTFDDYKDGE